jgi:hypothetical protein
MDQKTIPLYLARKRLSAVEIHADLVGRLGLESVGYPSVTHSTRQVKFVTSKPRVIFLGPNWSSMFGMRLSYSP